MSFIVDFTVDAKEELGKHKKAGQKKLVAKITTFILECQENPRNGTGKPERLKFMENEVWSREINKQHRFVYEIDENVVLVLSVWGHYDDK